MEEVTYLAMILGFGLPLLALEWAIGWREIRFEGRPIIATVVMATAYLGLADLAAIENGVWTINPDRTLGLRAGGFVAEDWLLLLVVNTVVAQFVVLVLDDDVRARVRHALRRRRRR